MAEAVEGRGRPGGAVLKVFYLVTVTAVAFAVPAVPATRPYQWSVLPGLLAVQVAILLACRVGPRTILRPVWRLKWFFLVLGVCYALLPPADGESEAGRDTIRLLGTAWAVPIDWDGLAHAGLMAVQILTVILASEAVRVTGSGADLVHGLRALGLPRLFVHSFDQTLLLLGGPRRPAREAGERRLADSPDHPAAPGFIATVKRLIRGDIGSLARSVVGGLDRARVEAADHVGGDAEPHLAHDVAVVAGVSLVMASLKMVKFLPGVPFAPGIKSLLLFPLYVVASQQTRSRWGGTAAGAVLGVVSFLQGSGRYGVLGVLQHVAPGVVIDLLRPSASRRLPATLAYCLIGLVAAVAWSSTEWLVVLLLGARAEVYLFPAAKLVPNLIAGTLSGFVTVAVLRALRDEELAHPGPPGDEQLISARSKGPGV